MCKEDDEIAHAAYIFPPSLALGGIRKCERY